MEMNEYGTKSPRLKRFPIYRDPPFRGCTVLLFLPSIFTLVDEIISHEFVIHVVYFHRFWYIRRLMVLSLKLCLSIAEL